MPKKCEEMNCHGYTKVSQINVKIRIFIFNVTGTNIAKKKKNMKEKHMLRVISKSANFRKNFKLIYK